MKAYERLLICCMIFIDIYVNMEYNKNVPSILDIKGDFVMNIKRSGIGKRIVLIVATLIILSACESDAQHAKDSADKPPEPNVSEEMPNETNSLPDQSQRPETSLINAAGETIESRVNTPEGFERVRAEEGSFGHYLRTLPLKPHGSKVRYYDGREKSRGVYEAVIDMDIGDRDLQQCADAVIRLRAEYLFNQKEYDRIHFNFTNGFNAQYSKWMQGYRIAVSGNNVRWTKTSSYSDDYSSFREYLDMVFAYAGTLSLSKELQPVAIEDMEIGDVFIQGGSPGHCVIVVDMAERAQTGERLFMLAQSYIPAQDIQLLKNMQEPLISPWYSSKFGETLLTPEWSFKKTDLKRFAN